MEKLRNRSGLTITELVITLLIFSLISSAVLVGISTSFSVRRDSILVSDAEILKSTVSQIIKQELRLSSEQNYPDEYGKFDDSKYNNIDTNTVEKWYVEYTGGVPVTGPGNQIARIGLNEKGYLMKRVGNNNSGTKPYQVLSSAAYGDPSHTHSAFSSSLFIDNLKFDDGSGSGNIDVSFEIFSGDKMDKEDDDIKILTAKFTVVPINKEKE